MTSELQDARGLPVTGPRFVESTRWLSLLVVYVAGVIAAMGLGKFSVFALRIQQDLDISMGQVGWVVSGITAVSALLGTPAGLRLSRMPSRGTLLTGLWSIVVAGALSGLSPGLALLLPLRVVEGVGYLMVVIACPTLIVRLSARKDQARALALWGTFVPVGLALSTALGGSVANWRVWMFVTAALTAVPAAVLAFTPVGTRTRSDPAAAPERGRSRLRDNIPVVLLALGFCMASLVTVAVFVLIPTFLERELGYSTPDAGATAGLISLVSVGGGLLIGWLMHRNANSRPVALGSCLVAVAAWAAFRPDAGATLFLTGAATISALNGVLVGLILASVPLLIRESGDSQLAYGIATQGGSMGSLLGPPLYTAGVERWGWSAIGWFSTAGMIACWLFLARALRPARKAVTGHAEPRKANG